jgi:transmembrane sensor
MLDRADKIRLLIRKYLAGDLSVEEQKEFDAWLSASEQNQKLLESFTNDILFDRLLKDYFESARVAENLEVPDVYQGEAGMVVKIKKPVLVKWIVAASILFLIAVSVFYNLVNSGKKDELSESTNQLEKKQPEIMPANGSAILVLDGERQVVLDSIESGTVTVEGGKEIVKQDGQLSYQGKSSRVVYNKLITTKGNVISLTLADGSKVWLNAKSSIRYRTEFDGDDRVVDVTGEAYFQVAKDAAKPFKVRIPIASADTIEVKVLGTHFNVNAYSDETSMRTTLLEGKIKISRYINNDSMVLEPGQQARIENSGELKVVDSVDMEAVVAWKQNVFDFNGDDVKTIMRQLARWYDISVKYEGDIPWRTFTGKIGRNLTLKEVLKVLEGGISGIKFVIKEREVVVNL